ncbi:MAG TPA: type II toxin-antitoxin system RelE/ParE family toxin [Candidatus Paceibacterota bacterium]
MKSSGEKFKIEYDPDVYKEDVPSVSSDWVTKIRNAIENKLQNYPTIFGKPLNFPLTGLWKLRVGDYRIVYTVSKMSVGIFIVGHRDEVYKLALRRLRARA